MLPWLCEFASRACRVVVMGCVLCARMFSDDWIFRWSCFILLHALVFRSAWNVEQVDGHKVVRCHISSRCAHSAVHPRDRFRSSARLGQWHTWRHWLSNTLLRMILTLRCFARDPFCSVASQAPLLGHTVLLRMLASDALVARGIQSCADLHPLQIVLQLCAVSVRLSRHFFFF